MKQVVRDVDGAAKLVVPGAETVQFSSAADTRHLRSFSGGQVTPIVIDGLDLPVLASMAEWN